MDSQNPQPLPVSSTLREDDTIAHAENDNSDSSSDMGFHSKPCTNERGKVMNTTLEKVKATEQIADVGSPGLTERQIYNRLKKIDALKAQIKTLETEEQKLRAEILGDAEAVAIDSDWFTLDAGKEPYKRFDSTLLKKEQPEVYSQYLGTAFRAKFRYKIK